jgi:hypothetical protein
VLRYGACLEQQAADQRTLSVVNVADDGQVLVRFVTHGEVTR